MSGSTSASQRERDVLVTGEAVLLDLRAASFATRLLSFLIDGALELSIQLLGILAVRLLVLSVPGFDEGFAGAGIVLATALGFIGYPVLTEHLMHGRSLGRLALGTRVVRLDGGPVHVRQSLLRAIVGIFEIWGTSGALALACSLVDHRSRRLGDQMAGTFVVQERLRAPAPVRVEVPAPLAAWAEGADMGRLDRELLQDIRAFLPRSAALNPESRRAIARELLEATVPSIAPPPPPGTVPEDFLRAVLAERSRRDEARLRRELRRERELSAEVRAIPFAS